jgi:prepilin-type N-terminal cleavage/methylation domain-containing protein
MTDSSFSILRFDDSALRELEAQPFAAGSDAGFSLVEVLVAAGLISFLLVGTAELLVQSIGVQRKTDRTLRITGLIAAESERIKSLPFEAGELAAGGHEIEIELRPGEEPVALAWTVEDQGPNLKKVTFKLSRNGRAGPPLEAVLLLSKDLGF